MVSVTEAATASASSRTMEKRKVGVAHPRGPDGVQLRFGASIAVPGITCRGDEHEHGREDEVAAV
jgi:hypothetical protein